MFAVVVGSSEEASKNSRKTGCPMSNVQSLREMIVSRIVRMLFEVKETNGLI